MPDDIYALLLELARAGWRTLICCREDASAGRVRISFGSESDAEAFLNLVVPPDVERDALAERARGRWGAWDRAVLTEGESALGEYDEWRFRSARVEGMAPDFSILVPETDVATVLRRLQRANASMLAEGALPE